LVRNEDKKEYYYCRPIRTWLVLLCYNIGMPDIPAHDLKKREFQFTALPACFRSVWFLVLCMVVISGLMFFLLMPTYPMQNWDEGIHAQVTREILDTGDWWTLHYQGELYFRKPPVKMWMTAPLLDIFGDHVWVHRFWSSIAGVASAALLAFFIYKKEKDLIAAWLSGLIFISGQFIFYHAFRTGETDALLIFFLLFGFFAYWKASQKPWWFILMGISFGLGIMTKSLAGAIGPIVVLLDVVVQKNWSVFRSRFFWSGIFSFLIVVLPWHLSMLSIYGKQFWDEYIGFHVVDRTFTQLYADLPWYWYGKMLVQRLFPLSFFLIGALLVPLWDSFRRKKQNISLVVLWLFVSLLLFTVVKTKFEWYILPAYAPAAWIIGRYLSRVIREQTQPFLLATFGASVFLVFAKIPSAILPGAKTYWFSLQAYIPGTIQNSMSNPYVWSAFFMVLLAILYWIVRKKNTRFVGVLFILLILHSLGFAFGRNAGTIFTESHTSIYQQIAKEVSEKKPSRVVTYKTDLYDKPAGYFELYGVVHDIVNVKDSSADFQKAIQKKSIVITSVDTEFEGRPLIAHIDQYYIYGE